MWVRMEKIIATVLHEAHERQIEEAMEALGEGPEGFTEATLTERRRGTNGDGSYTAAEAAQILHVPLRRVLECLRRASTAKPRCANQPRAASPSPRADTEF